MIEFSALSRCGRKRKEEGVHFVQQGFIDDQDFFGAIFDGYGGGSQFAKLAKKLVPSRFCNLKVDYGHDDERAFRAAYDVMSEEFNASHAGCTALSFILRGNDLTVANAGDSRLLIVSNDGRLDQVTEDHNTANAREVERVELCGAKIYGGYITKGVSSTMLTRSLGRHFFNDVGVISRPDIFARNVKQDQIFIIAANDSLWNEFGNKKVVEIVTGKKTAQEAGKALIKNAFSNGNDRDISLIVVKI